MNRDIVLSLRRRANQRIPCADMPGRCIVSRWTRRYCVSMETWLVPISANIKKCRSREAFPYICGQKMSHSFASRNEALSMHGTDAPPSNRPINNRPPLLASSSPCSLRQSRPSFFLSSPSLAYFFFPSCIQGSRTSFAREEKYTREMRQSSVSLREFFTANKIRVGSLKRCTYAFSSRAAAWISF